ncbi:MAG: S9 family peptidase [Vicinamibacterales bacterium]|jgi:dipeptidyl aminopeptidase/acylaminoacyl peptidase|nr:dipeptidyl aminopeptidase [Acidobacteriota bacterium]MDP6373294.1 S9 family peptidase [Vicinamibacterales bacterium]MDP6608421.1 S9 family peptidase [Vicinamibacterales bacterium]HAK56411.1 dipeptidyl aminopeptidase [Acidobacteriota bacterium]|tara:strand:- start:5096 stop:7150 length:2055 start_codon:yes stop_codon:yes gene_type:complete
MRDRFIVAGGVAFLLVAFGTVGAVAAQEPSLLDHDSFFEMETIRSPAIAPDGSLIVFSREWVDQQADRFRSNLWIVDSDGARVRELTHGDWSDSAPVWSPDGTRIAFLSDRDETTQIHVMWVDTREVAQLTHLERAPSNLRWSPDGTRIAFSLFMPDETSILPVKLPKAPRAAERAAPAVVIDRLSWARDGRGPVEPGFTHAFVIGAELGGTPRQITDGDYNHNSPEWSADGRTLYVSAIRRPEAEYLRGNSEIYAFDVETREATELTDRNGPDTSPLVSPDGEWIAFTGYDDQNFTSTLRSLYVMRVDGADRRPWATDLNGSPGSIRWASDSSGVYYTVGERGVTNVYFSPLDGEPGQMLTGVHTLAGLSIAENGQAVAVRSSFTQPGDLVTLRFDGGTDAEVRSLVDVNADVLSTVALSDAEELWYESSDGFRVQGWLIKPANFDPSQEYPLLLWIHGGPWSMYSVRFNWAFQNFAAQGYAVLYTNPRGSTGYGQEFVNGIQFSYPGKDLDDLLAGVDAAVETGWIDEDNLFVCGGSGGGVLTAWIVGHDTRFAAAVSMRPVINWHSFVGTTDGSGWYRQFEQYPWEDPMEYAVRSPLHYVANVTTPTMVMTGEADLRTPMSQSEEYYRALKMLKKETLLVRMPDEFHGWRRPSHRLLQQLYLQAWFEKYRRGGMETTEQPQ